MHCINHYLLAILQFEVLTLNIQSIKKTGYYFANLLFKANINYGFYKANTKNSSRTFIEICFILKIKLKFDFKL